MAQSTTKPGYYGADTAENVFSLPGSNEKYFTLVNEKTGEIEIWENDSSGFSMHDKRVGNINPETGKVEFNQNWWGGANNFDKKIINNNLALIKANANTTAANGILAQNPGMKPEAALNRAKGLTKSNAARESEDIKNALSRPAPGLTKDWEKALGESETGTREKKNSFGVYVFPEALRSAAARGQDFLKIDMLSYKPRGIKPGKNSSTLLKIGERPRERETLGSVILPIPGGIQDNQQVSWNSDKMDPWQLALANIALTTIEKGVGKGVETAGSFVDQAMASMDTKTALGTYFAAQATGAQNLLTRTTGAIMNPNMDLLFNSPELRTFSFAFLLAPRSQKEAMQVVKIIRFFKQGMAPIRSKARLFLKSPHTFRLAYKQANASIESSFGTNNHPYLNKFKECALGSFGVNYTPNGQYSTYEDGVMTAYQITMTFRELSPIFNDDYGNSPQGTLPQEIGY